METYKRNIDELRETAVLHWPDHVLEAAGAVSVLPLLLRTQDLFISILKVASKTPTAWLDVLNEASDLSGPLFLKHLMVLTDLGGEALNKLPPLSKYFENGNLVFVWKDTEFEYSFKEIGEKCSLANSALKVDSKKIIAGGDITEKMIDVCMLLMFGGSGINDTLPTEVKEKCIIGSLLGNPPEIEKYVKENYIRVSRQVGGALSNELGTQVQLYVATALKSYLPENWIIKNESFLPGVSHKENGGETNFDVVVKSPSDNYFAVEVSFQVTTNSVIERKSREAENVQNSAHAKGHNICYVIDGAGNINIRKNAVGTICSYSDCTVTLQDSEIQFLAKFMMDTAASNEK